MAVICSVAVAPLARLPTVQTPALYAAAGLALTNEYPAGRASLTLTPVAADGPRLVAVRVKTTCEPTFGVALSTVLAMARSDCGTGLVDWLLVLLPVSGSCSVPVIVATLR